jgi:hypothetical protein
MFDQKLINTKNIFVLFRLEERNAHLRLVYQELQKQLNDLREERIGLQLLLDTVHKSSPPSN